MDYFFRGINDSSAPRHGILFWCGVESNSHEGSLKRICGHALSLVHTLVYARDISSSSNGNPFYDHFIQMPQEDLLKINFTRHIAPGKKSGLTVVAEAAGAQNTRSRSKVLAMELLGLLVDAHVGADGEPDPIDVNLYLNNSEKGKERFRKWSAKNKTEKVRLHARVALLYSLRAASEDTRSVQRHQGAGGRTPCHLAGSELPTDSSSK